MQNIEQALEVKVKKYEILDLGRVLPFIIGSLGSWPISNDLVKSSLKNSLKYDTFYFLLLI